jgi:hypothetical protein
MPIIFAHLVVTNAFSIDIWVKWWATSNLTDPNGRLGYWLGIYSALGGLALVSLVVSCWSVFNFLRLLLS